MATRPKRAKGTGTINERPDGRFNCAITVQTLLGPRRFTTTPNTYRDGERWIAKIRRDYERTVLSPDGRSMTVSDYCPLWLDSIEGTVAPKTHSEYADKFRLHIAPRHDRIRLMELTTPHVNALYKDMEREGASPGSSSPSTPPTARPCATPRRGTSSGRTPRLSPARRSRWRPSAPSWAARFLEEIRGDRQEAPSTCSP